MADSSHVCCKKYYEILVQTFLIQRNHAHYSMTLTILLTSLTAVRLQSRVSLDERDASNTKFRSLSDILQDCIPMIFFCAWVAVHRNIPPYREKIWLAILGRLRMLFWVIITPELVLAWAARQWVAAREIAKIYNNHFPGEHHPFRT